LEAQLSLYDRLSPWYDWLAASERPLARRAVAFLDLQPGERVLEIGCGTGGALADMATLTGPDGFSLGVDLSAGMLHQTHRRLRTQGCASAWAVRASALVLPLSPASFHALLATFTFELFPPAALDSVLSECRRILRPGGRIVAASLLATEYPGWMERFYIGFHNRYPHLADCRPIQFDSVLHAGGFTVRYCERHDLWGLPVMIALAD
jgi:demethylmenaquinone methyltransferase/2-methoxy-6-polyprenyl-1,4-benzoquinol methylase